MQNNAGGATLELFVSADVNTSGTVSMPQMGFSVPFAVTANVTTTLILDPAWLAEHSTSEVLENRGLLIETADTVALFAINHASATGDGTKVLPTQTLGTNYRVNAYHGLVGWSNQYKSEMLIVATEDGTEVEVTPTAQTVAGNLPGVPFLVNLDAGQSYQIQAAIETDDFTGTTITASDISGSCRPFAVFSGANCTGIPAGCIACDHIFEQNFPLESWGTTYYTVPFLGPGNYTYKVMADQNNTQVTVNGGAPFILNAGETMETNNFLDAACIVGNKPMSVVQYMQSQSCSSGQSDPAMLILNDESQKIDNITFSTVTSALLTQHNLNVIMETPYVNQLTLDGTPVPAASFSPYPACPGHSYAQLPITAGSHTLDAQVGGFTAYVYGLGNFESYAYSVGSFSREPIIEVDTVLCTSDTVTLAAPPGLFTPYWIAQSDLTDTLHWGNIYEFVPTVSEIYIVYGNQFISGCEEEYQFSVEIPTPPQLTLSASATTVCAYSEVQLNVAASPQSSIYEYIWSPATELNDPYIPNPVAQPSNSTWYSVGVSTPSGCGGQTVDSILVNVTPGVVLDLETTTAQDYLCLGDSSQLEVNVQQIILGDTFDGGITAGLWTGVTGGIASQACGAVSGDALYFDGAPPTRQAETVDLDVSAGGSVQFALKIANGMAPCDNADPGENVVLEYSTNGGGAWTLIATYLESGYPNFTNINEPIPAGAQTVATRFRWSQITFSAAGEDNWALDNANVAVFDNTGISFAWNPATDLSDAAIPDPMSYPTLAGYFYVDVVDNNTQCDYQDSVYIDVGLPFSINLPNDTALCDVAGIQLDAAPSSGTGHTWAWTPNNGTLSSAVIQDPIATPLATTTYYVDVESGQGCTAMDSVTINVNQLLSLDIISNVPEICLGDSAYLEAVVANPVGLTFDWLPTLGLSNAAIQDPAASPPITTNYIVHVTDTATGCLLIDSLELIVNSLYYANATEDTTVCTALGFQLDVDHNVSSPTFTWSPVQFLNNGAIQTPLIQLDSSMQYVVEIEDNVGCSVSDTVNITVAFDDLTFISDSAFCQGENMIIDAGYPGFTYDWSTGETTQTITVGLEDDYTVIITDNEGCQTTFTTMVTVDPLPFVNLGADTLLCGPTSLILDAGNPGSEFLWNTTQVTQTININTNQLAWVQVTDGNNCVNADSLDVFFAPLPVIPIADTTVCVSETITLDAENTGSTYLWSTGETTQTIAVNSTANFQVIVTTADLCVDSADVDIQLIEFPMVDLGPDSILCDTEIMTLDAGNPGESYSWNTGETSQSINVLSTDNYFVAVYNGYCTTNDSVDVLFNPLPEEFLDEQVTYCNMYPPKVVVLDAGNAGSTFLWSNGESTQNIVVGDYGIYTVTITTPEGCSILDEILVDEFCPPTIFIPNAFTPDGDGNNDEFFVNGHNLASVELMVFDRWGELIYENNANMPWDGRVNGRLVQDGVYAYRVVYRFFTDQYGSIGTENEQIGHVTVIR